MRRTRVVLVLASLALAGCGAEPAARIASIAPRPLDAVERSHRLARLPDRLAEYGDLRMRTPEFLAFAKRWEALVPYPPDYDGHWEWVRGTAEWHEVQHVPQLLVHDATCSWYRYWLRQYDSGLPMEDAPATVVLEDIAHWPFARRDRRYYEAVAEEAPTWPSVVRNHIRDRCTPDEVPGWLERELRRERKRAGKTYARADERTSASPAGVRA